jgi:hypothetical protein
MMLMYGMNPHPISRRISTSKKRLTDFGNYFVEFVFRFRINPKDVF